MAKHLDILGILFWCYGAFQLFIAVFIFVLYSMMGAGIGILGVSEGEDEMAIMGIVMVLIAVILGLVVLVQSLLPIFAGFGIRKRKNWGRILGMISGGLGLMSIPFGTALGIYAFVVLLDKESAAEFS